MMTIMMRYTAVRWRRDRTQHVLVIEDNVWIPNLLHRNTNIVDATVVGRVPRQ